MIAEKTLLPINFSPGRKRKADVITIHVMEGTMKGTWQHFNNPASKVSSHYGVSLMGNAVQYVDEKDRAWTNGRVFEPTAPIVLDRDGINPNDYTISIEFEGTGQSDLTPPQRAKGIELIRDIAARNTIPIDRTRIIRHNEIYAKKTCPGRIDVDRLVRECLMDPIMPMIVYSPYKKDYLVVTRIVSDTEWYFVPLASIKKLEQRSQASLHDMPTSP